MKWDDTGPGKRRGYHHGNLREALMDAALHLIGEKGSTGFTIAEAARAAGVSPAAPYRHFRDRDALIAEVAERGFDAFARSLATAWNEGRPSPRAAFKAVGSAYLAFANTQPAAYSAMFESGLRLSDHPGLQAASDRAFKVLKDACEAVVAGVPAGRRPPALMVALHVWALAHGIASLFARGDAARRPLPMEPEDLLEAAVLIYIDGLAAPTTL
jgi:AcrR family transcriptional regulator